MAEAHISQNESGNAQGPFRPDEELAREILDTIPVPIWSGPRDGTLDYCNRPWRSYATILEAARRDVVQVVERYPRRIDLVVSDLVMPHLGGRQLVERLTAMQPGVRVLFLSGYTDDAVVRHGVRDAEYAFLQKPFTPTALAQKVREVLDHEP